MNDLSSRGCKYFMIRREGIAYRIEMKEYIDKMLDDDPQLQLQVNRGHWERLLPIIIAKVQPLLDELKEIKEHQSDTEREKIKNYAAKWFDKGRDFGNAPIIKDMLTELEKDGDQILSLISKEEMENTKRVLRYLVLHGYIALANEIEVFLNKRKK